MRKVVGLIAFCCMVFGVADVPTVSALDSMSKQRIKQLKKDPEVREYIKLMKKKKRARQAQASNTDSDEYGSDQPVKKKKKKKKKKNRMVQNSQDDYEPMMDSENQMMYSDDQMMPDSNQMSGRKKKKKNRRSKKNRANQMNQMDQQMDGFDQMQTSKSKKSRKSRKKNKKNQIAQMNGLDQMQMSNSKKKKKGSRRNRKKNKMALAPELINTGGPVVLNEPIIDGAKIQKSSLVVEKDIKLASNAETKKVESKLVKLNLSPIDQKEVSSKSASEKEVKLVAHLDDSDKAINEKLSQVSDDRKIYNLIRTPNKDLKDNIQVNKFREELDFYRKMYATNLKKA